MMRRILFLLVFVLAASGLMTYAAGNYIRISKPKMMLYVLTPTDSCIFQAPIACGVNYGNKTRAGDHRTPEGVFTVCSIERASGWSHDFHDGAGKRPHAYGDWFIRLRVPTSTHIGIHGTCFPNSIGTRSSDGCVRLNNEMLNKLKPLVRVGMKCIIEPDSIANGSNPGNKTKKTTSSRRKKGGTR